MKDIVELGGFEKNEVEGVDSLLIRLYDTPGYGDSIDNQPYLDKIRRDLISRHQNWSEMYLNHVKPRK